MKFRLGLGKVFGFLRPRWGVRGSLFAAFAVIAAMAIVISAGAGYVLQQLGVRMVDLSGRDIPRLAASLQLSAQSAGLAAQGPGLLADQSPARVQRPERLGPDRGARHEVASSAIPSVCTVAGIGPLRG